MFLTATCSLFCVPQASEAMNLYRAKQYKEAIKVCEAKIKVNPSDIESHTILCWSLLLTGQYLQAEERAQNARKINSTDIRLIEALAEAKYRLGKNDEALTYFQKYVSSARESDGDFGLSYFFMGEIYIKQAKYQHADIALTTAVRSKPQNATWWTRLGYAREQCKSYASAVEAYNKALSVNPSYADAVKGKERCQTHL